MTSTVSSPPFSPTPAVSPCAVSSDADKPAPEFGSPHRHFRVTDSTNTRARELAEAGRPRRHRGHRARTDRRPWTRGRIWTAPAGKALLYSAILRPLDRAPPAAAALSPARRLRRRRGPRVPEIELPVKWPNDVWLEGSKLSGILIEARPQDGWAVIGIGLNLPLPRRSSPPTSVNLRFRSSARRRESGGVPTEQQRGGSVGTSPDSLNRCGSSKSSPRPLGRRGRGRGTRRVAPPRRPARARGCLGGRLRRRRRNRRPRQPRRRRCQRRPSQPSAPARSTCASELWRSFRPFDAVGLRLS